jgi:hypothetical protein
MPTEVRAATTLQCLRPARSARFAAAAPEPRPGPDARHHSQQDIRDPDGPDTPLKEGPVLPIAPAPAGAA